MKINEEELDEFLNNHNQKKVFFDFLDSILYLRNKGASLSCILDFIFTKSDGYKKKYEKRKSTAINILSKLIRDNNDKMKSLPSKEDKVEKIDNIRGTDQENINSEIPVSKEVDIELTNNEIKKCTLSYLKADYIADSSGLILEKNIYSFKNNYNDISMNMEKLEDILNENPFIENYSLIVYVDEGKTNNAFVHRLINKELILLNKLSVYDFVVKMEDIEKKATKRFYDNIVPVK